MEVKKLFINSDSGIIRTGWRILIFIVLFAAITAVVMVGTRTILGGLKAGSNLQFALLALSATFSVFIARKYIDKKPMISLGLKWNRYAMYDLLSGLLNSALVMSGIYLLMLGSGLIEFQGFVWWQDPETLTMNVQFSAWFVVGGVLIRLTIVAWWEELVFRGYFFQNLMTGTNTVWAVVITSLVFGLGHYFNPSGTLLSSFLIVLLTPQLIYAYLKTGQLWLPIGLHLGWNFFQGPVFGFAASGNQLPSLISQIPVGPDWLTGGAFGAEGSILLIPFILLSIPAIHFWVKISRYPEQKPLELAVEIN